MVIFGMLVNFASYFMVPESLPLWKDNISSLHSRATLFHIIYCFVCILRKAHFPALVHQCCVIDFKGIWTLTAAQDLAWSIRM